MKRRIFVHRRFLRRIPAPDATDRMKTNRHYGLELSGNPDKLMHMETL
ncbi:MAG: hypothetical protein K5770_10775 [Lachnospiraceae bacterium]|nr:hypothetical protein [Lachnospiraceae bacterium]